MERGLLSGKAVPRPAQPRPMYLGCLWGKKLRAALMTAKIPYLPALFRAKLEASQHTLVATTEAAASLDIETVPRGATELRSETVP